MPSASANRVTGREPAPSPLPGRRPRVLQVITKLDLGGAESVAIDLIDALHDEVDFAVFVVMALEAPSRVGRDMAERLARWHVPSFTGTAGHFKKGGALVAAWRLARAVTRFRADVVHLHTETPELTYALSTVLAPRLRKVAMLRTVHNTELWIAWGGVGRWVTDRLAASGAIAVSEGAADTDAAIPTRNARARATVVSNGVMPPPMTTRRGKNPYRLLFAARFVPAKGSDLLPTILAAAHAATNRRDVEVTIAGSGPQEAELRQALTGIAPGWTITVAPPIERLGQRLGEWDQVLMPSRFEGLGLLAIEALMAGVPLVTTRCPGVVEVIPADYAYGAPVDDARRLGELVAQVIDDEERARAAIAPLRNSLVARFSPAAMAQGYLAAYRRLGGVAA